MSLWKSRSKLNNWISLINISSGIPFILPSEYNEFLIKNSLEAVSKIVSNSKIFVYATKLSSSVKKEVKVIRREFGYFNEDLIKFFFIEDNWWHS